MLDHNEKHRRGLPIREFMYTLDQIAFILNIGVDSIRRYVIFTDVAGRRQPKSTPGRRADDRMQAVRINPSDFHEQPEWRVPEQELIRFLKSRRMVIYERRLR